MNSLDNCINYLLTGAQHSVFQYMKKNLAQFDITPIQYGVLGCIWEFDMHNPKDIAAHLGVEPRSPAFWKEWRTRDSSGA